MGAVFDKISGLLFRHAVFWCVLFVAGAAYILTQSGPVYGVPLEAGEKTFLLGALFVFCLISGIVTRFLSVWIWQHGPYAYAPQTVQDMRALREHIAYLEQHAWFEPGEDYRRHLRACADYVARVPTDDLRRDVLQIMAYGADMATEKDPQIYKALEKRLAKSCKAFLRQTNWVHHYRGG